MNGFCLKLTPEFTEPCCREPWTEWVVANTTMVGAALTGLFLLTYWQLECCGHIQEILVDDIKITCKAKPHFLQHSVTPRKNMKMDILQTSNPWIILFTDPAHLETTTADASHANQAHVPFGAPPRYLAWLCSLLENSPPQFQVHLAFSMIGFQLKGITVLRTKNVTI